MSTPAPPVEAAPATAPQRTHDALTVLAGAAILALLYFGREVLVPITLAGLLSLLLAPLVRYLKRLGLGQVPAVLGAVAVETLAMVGVGAIIVSQAIALAGSLPQYETTIRAKVADVQAATLGRMQAMQGEAGRVIGRLASAPAATHTASRLPVTADGVVPVEIHERPLGPLELVARVASSVWGPLGTAGIVLVVLVFALLEHEALRDRFIRLAGGADLRATTHAFNDAGTRLSRYFVSQFAVNVGVGAIAGLGLWLLGVPQAPLWFVLTAVLRFVPYVGVAVAALSAALLAAAVDPGWSLAFMTLALFAVVEVVAAQAVEPFLYGHSTGLSPLSVVIAAIFWSWIWGPVGLLLSTPLTLCLVVAGRHVRALAFLDILLGDTPALTMSQRFYQRAISGDADEIIAAAREYLKRRSFARYCDAILMPALRLAGADLASGSISAEQVQHVRGVIVAVIEALGPDAHRRTRRRSRVSVLDEQNVGRHLRRKREEAMGKYQGPLEVPPGSVVLCVGLGTVRDDLVTEVLVRVLRGMGIDARHIAMDDVDAGPPPGADPASIAMVYFVSFPERQWGRGLEVAGVLRERFAGATLVALAPDPLPAEQERALDAIVDVSVHSFEEAAAQARRRYPDAGRPPRAADAAGSPGARP